MQFYRTLAKWIGWPTIVAALLIAGGYSYWLLNNRIEALKEANQLLLQGSVKQELSASGIKITSHRDEDSVDEMFTISGTYASIPNGSVLRVFVLPSRGGGYWPQEKVEYDEEGKSWRCTVHLGSEPGDSAVVIATLVGPDGQVLINYYDKVAQEVGRWVGIADLTTDILEVDRVKVNRK